VKYTTVFVNTVCTWDAWVISDGRSVERHNTPTSAAQYQSRRLNVSWASTEIAHHLQPCHSASYPERDRQSGAEATQQAGNEVQW